MSRQGYTRPQGAELLRRLGERRRFMQVVTGARQVGKTTLVTQVVEKARLPYVFASADEPTLRGSDWIDAQWEAARLLLRDTGQGGALLVLDEVQKVPHWSEAVKRPWDTDTRARRPLKVVLLGSAPLLVQRGLTESLAGRFEIVHLPHWTPKCRRRSTGTSSSTCSTDGIPEPRRIASPARTAGGLTQAAISHSPARIAGRRNTRQPRPGPSTTARAFENSTSAFRSTEPHASSNSRWPTRGTGSRSHRGTIDRIGAHEGLTPADVAPDYRLSSNTGAPSTQRALFCFANTRPFNACATCARARASGPRRAAVVFPAPASD
jgi:hypothetical protein